MYLLYLAPSVVSVNYIILDYCNILLLALYIAHNSHAVNLPSKLSKSCLPNGKLLQDTTVYVFSTLEHLLRSPCDVTRISGSGIFCYVINRKMTPFGNFIVEFLPIAGIRSTYDHHGSCSLILDYCLLK